MKTLIWVLSCIVAAVCIGTEVDTAIDGILLSYIVGSIILGIKLEQDRSDRYFELRRKDGTW